MLYILRVMVYIVAGNLFRVKGEDLYSLVLGRVELMLYNSTQK